MTARNILVAGAASVLFSFCNNTKMDSTQAQTSDASDTAWKAPPVIQDHQNLSQIALDQKSGDLLLKNEKGDISVLEIAENAHDTSAYRCRMIGITSIEKSRASLAFMLKSQAGDEHEKAFRIFLSIEECDRFWKQLSAYQDTCVKLTHKPVKQTNTHWSSPAYNSIN